MSKAADAHDEITSLLGLLEVLYDATQASGVHDDHVTEHYAAFVRILIEKTEAIDALLSQHLDEVRVLATAA